jgi:hypothetical protein
MKEKRKKIYVEVHRKELEHFLKANYWTLACHDWKLTKQSRSLFINYWLLNFL